MHLGSPPASRLALSSSSLSLQGLNPATNQATLMFDPSVRVLRVGPRPELHDATKADDCVLEFGYALFHCHAPWCHVSPHPLL